jgi:hypothetical protein
VELARVAEALPDVATLRALLADRERQPSLLAALGPPRQAARYVQIEAEALGAALLVRNGIATLDQIWRLLDGPTWLGLGAVRAGTLAEADLPWLFENRRVLHGRAQAYQAQGFADALAAASEGEPLMRVLHPWLLSPRDPTRSAMDLLRAAIPRAVELVRRADLERHAPATPCDGERPYDGLIYGYRILAPLSQGSRGVVYRARHVITGRDVALKVLPLRHANNHGRGMEFWREAVAMSRVQSPHVVSAYDFGGCKDYYFFASDLIADRRFDPHDIVRALIAIRDAGMVHRDVIPSNIRGGRLLDFGDVWFQGDIRVPGRDPAGTVAYMAPEETAGGAVDERTDQYMLGMVLREQGGAPADVIARMTQPRPDDRYPTLEAVLDALATG